MSYDGDDDDDGDDNTGESVMVVVWRSGMINILFQRLAWCLLTGQLALGRDWRNWDQLRGYYRYKVIKSGMKWTDTEKHFKEEMTSLLNWLNVIKENV